MRKESSLDTAHSIILMLLSTYMNFGSRQTKTNDKVVREKLISHLKNKEVGSVVFEEFDIERGKVRADVVYVSDNLVHGYEIKSDVDTLARLPNQVKYYNQVFSTVTLVVGSRHIVEAMSIIPDWWGVVVATQSRNDITLNTIRETKENRSVSYDTVTDLLHKNELIEILRIHAPGRTYSSMTKPMLKCEAKQTLPLDKLYTCLSNSLVKRGQQSFLRA